MIYFKLELAHIEKNISFNLNSTIRACEPEKTLQKITPLLKQVGITRIANVTGLDNIGIPVAICIRPNSKHLSVSQGKGSNWELAKISAIMESIEGYHAENPREPDLIGPYLELKESFELINPNTLSKGFFKYDLENINLEWIKGFDLINNKEAYVPYSAVCLDSSRWRQNSALFDTNSNGLAAGNTLTEAILHGIYEVVERDALFRWTHFSPEEKYKKQIKLASIQSKSILELINKLLTARQLINIWNITTSLNIPTYYCAIKDLDNIRNLGIFYGSGSHISAEIALSRALLEAAQSRLTFITGTRDEIFPQHYQNRHTHTQFKNWRDGKLILDTTSVQSHDHSLTENLNEIINRLITSSFSKIIIVDHTKSELDIPVVHVFIPGMNANGKWL